MPLTMTLTDRQQMFGAGLDKRLRKLELAERAARTAAATAATKATATGFKYVRPVVAPRPGRASDGSHFSKLVWKVTPDGVAFDTAQADKQSPHWIIQEIGTGSRALMRTGGQANAAGRPKTGASHVRTVKSQKGRRISGGLIFASGGQYSPTGSAAGEQLQLASKVRGVPRGVPAIVIKREIKGQHFVKEGGTQGFRQYRTSVMAAARQAFSQASTP